MRELEFRRGGVRVDETYRMRMRAPRMRIQLAGKRAFDIVGSATLLVLTAPLVFCGAVATIVSSPGNPFFAAKRWGTGDRLFRCFKLRTMHVDQDAILARHGLNDRGPQGRLLLFDRDPRITPVGSFLRKTSIDELPQLWNVLRGDMSLIGPRPLSPYMLEEYAAIRSARGVMRPGISGLWQVRNRIKNASVLDMIEDDGEYLATFDLSLDWRILLATFPRIVEPAGRSPMMDETRKLILIEFNELSATLLAKFMAEGDLPNFDRFYNASTAYRTTAGDDPLEPWVQWPSVHCGVPYSEHRALNLGDGARITQKAMGTVLSENGIPVGIFGMINGNYDRPNGYHVPDPWDTVHAPHPDELKPFCDFVAHQVQENTRGFQLDLRQTLTFATFMLRHGLSISTVGAALKQLLSERLRPGIKWKRVAVLDLLQYDLFGSSTGSTGFASPRSFRIAPLICSTTFGEIWRPRASTRRLPQAPIVRCVTPSASAIARWTGFSGN
jgi:lipopolysaccharide/colanic/teichoic acid biosynthesis glycosyltransferase